MHAPGNGSMNPGVEAVQQRHDLTDLAFFQTHIQIQPACAGLRPAAARAELAESVRRLVGARRFAVELHVPLRRTAGWRRDIQVRIGQIEDGLGVAEFEIDASGAHVQFRNGADHRPVQQRLEVPAAWLGRAAGLGQVDAGVIQPDGCEFQVPAENGGEPRHGFQGSHISDRLDADGGVLVDYHVIDREARPGEQAEVDGAQLDLPAQRAFERRLDAWGEPIAAQVGRGDTSRQ